MRYAQLVMGPAGCGKSTYCTTVARHCEAAARSVHVVNLDPAAEVFQYEPSIDIRDLVTLDDVVADTDLGPNGGLIRCLEHLTENLDWLEEHVGQFSDDYLIVDCPGQIELYTHFPIMRRIKDALLRWDYRVCAVYLIDAQFAEDPAKFFAGTLTALSTMIQLEVPHINVLSKMDLYDRKQRGAIHRYLNADTTLLLADLNASTSSRFQALNHALASLIDEYGMVSFLPLNIRSERSVALVLSHVDNAMQYGEDEEPKDHDEAAADDEP